MLTYPRGPSVALQTIAKSIVNNSPLFQLPSTGDDSNYLLTFRAPHVKCSIHNTTFRTPSPFSKGYIRLNDIRRVDTSKSVHLYMSQPFDPNSGIDLDSPPWWLINFTYRHDHVSEIFSPTR